MNIERVEQISIDALKAAHVRHNDLGMDGTVLVQKNQFGETAMRGDIEAEEAGIDVFAQSGLPIFIISEEHDSFPIGEKPRHTAIFDGIDGSFRYQNSFGTGTYATLLGVYPWPDPAYGDYLFSGMMLHGTKQLFYSVAGQGSFVLNVETGETTPVHIAGPTEVDANIRIHLADHWPEAREVFELIYEGDYNVVPVNSYSECYAEIISGAAALLLTCTGKKNLEPAAAYGFFTQAGGVMETLEGEDLGPKKYETFGQDKRLPLIVAANRALANDLRSLLG